MHVARTPKHQLLRGESGELKAQSSKKQKAEKAGAGAGGQLSAK
jgi:hypothetical protein